jgi:putative peptidoglycan lipid II flippase
VADAFFVAFMIPNLFRRLLGEGALTAAFIPLFKQKEKTEGDAAMWDSANAVISGLFVASGIIALAGIAAVSAVLVWGGIESGKTLLMLRLLRVMLPYVLLASVTAVLIGMLNARGHFFVPALGAALLNVVMIASVFWLAPMMGVTLPQQIFGLAVGVLLAGVLQMSFQLPLLHGEGFRYRWVSPWTSPVVRDVSHRMLPALVGVAAFQINVLVASGFAFAVGNEIVSAFNFAVRLMELPQGVFGLSLATYLLPTLSGLAAEKRYPEFRATLRDGIGYLTFVNLLASVLLIVLAEPMIRLLFERGSFQPEDTPEVAVALQPLAVGLVAYSLVNILGRAFYALGDTGTPMRISMFCLALNAVLTLPLVWTFKQAGLGMANTTTGIINVSLLFFALKKKLKTLELGSLHRQMPAFVTAAGAAAVAAYAAAAAWSRYIGHAAFAARLGEVFVPIALATAVYFGGAVALRLPYAGEMLRLLRRRTANDQ